MRSSSFKNLIRRMVRNFCLRLLHWMLTSCSLRNCDVCPPGPFRRTPGKLTSARFHRRSYVDATTASYQNLTSTTPHGSTILSIDSTTRLPLGAPRNSVRLTSKAVVNPGQLIVVDLAHAPVGCAAWPSFWMYGRQTPWPSSGGALVLRRRVRGSGVC